MEYNDGSSHSSCEAVNVTENHPECCYMTPNEVVWRLPKRMKIDSLSRFRNIKKNFSVDSAQMLPSTKPSPTKEMMSHPSSKSIDSVMIVTREASNNADPPICQPATTAIEKKQNRDSSDKKGIEPWEEEITNKEIIVQSRQGREI